MPNDTSMWEHLDEHHHGYQDSIVLHMIHKPIRVSLKSEEEERYGEEEMDGEEWRGMGRGGEERDGRVERRGMRRGGEERDGEEERCVTVISYLLLPILQPCCP